MQGFWSAVMESPLPIPAERANASGLRCAAQARGDVGRKPSGLWDGANPPPTTRGTPLARSAWRRENGLIRLKPLFSQADQRARRAAAEVKKACETSGSGASTPGLPRAPAAREGEPGARCPRSQFATVPQSVPWTPRRTRGGVPGRRKSEEERDLRWVRPRFTCPLPEVSHAFFTFEPESVPIQLDEARTGTDVGPRPPRRGPPAQAKSWAGRRVLQRKMRASCAHVGPRRTRAGHTLWDRAATELALFSSVPSRNFPLWLRPRAALGGVPGRENDTDAARR